GMFGVTAEEMEHLGDDRIGRALDRLFDADRAALLTDVVLVVGQAFALKFDEFHNDSTTISFCGAYRAASGRKIRGRTAPAITYGFNKDHRPDLKQLLFILTMAADGNIPVAFRCTDGNTNDSRTHIETYLTHPAGVPVWVKKEHTAHRRGAGRLPLCRRLQTMFAREHGPYRSRRGPLRPRAAEQSLGGRTAPQMDTNQHARVDPGVGPSSAPLCRRTARPLVRLLRATTIVGRLVRRMGVEHLAYLAPRGQATEEYGRGQRRALRVT